MGKRRRDAPGTRPDARRIERALRRLGDRLERRGIGQEVKHARRARLRGEAAVLERSERREDVGLLIAPPDADPRPAVRRLARDVVALVDDAAARCREVARQQIDERRLPGPVRTDDRMQLPELDSDGDAPLTAARPPKRRVRSRVARIVSVDGG